MANPRKFSEKIALHNQKQAEETAAFEQIMREVSDATNKVNSSSRRARAKDPTPPVEIIEIDSVHSTLRPTLQSLGTFRSGSLPNVAAPQATNAEPEQKPEEATLATQYGLGGGHSGGTSPSRNPGQRGRASSSVGPMRRPADRKHDTSPYGSTVYLSPPPDSNWRRTNSDSALHQSCGEQQVNTQPLSPHHPLHSHAHPHLHPHHNHRRGDIQLNVLLGMNPNNRPRSSCEIPGIPNNNKVYESGGDGGMLGPGGGGLACGELQVPGGSLPDLTSVHFPPAHYHRPPAAPSPDYHQPRYSPTSPGAVSPGGGSVSPATGGLSPASGSPVGATVPLATTMHHQHDHSQLYDIQNHLSVPNTNNYLHHNKNMSPLDHGWIPSGYQSNCSPPSQYSSTSNINIPSPTMVHSPGSPAAESPQTTDYSNLHQLLQPFEQITMDWAQLVQTLVESGWANTVQIVESLDQPPSNYNTSYMNHNSPHSPQTTSSAHTYPQSPHHQASSTMSSMTSMNNTTSSGFEPRQRPRDPVPGGGAFPTLQPLASPSAPQTPATPASIPDIILTDYSGELDRELGIFGGEEVSQLRAGLDLDDLTLLEEPSALLPDSSVEHEFRLDRL
ncbi:CREB-regulated transcription coactivator 3-like isoform X2 [Hyposmocoma kahamanoa]|uniref:CREB-regulated transcription coactivator 3-like isoform X2 n=1 Tax=Hyposmocoma kahamanoa TaxID=1477025 RepID=UPI000E6D92BB|nr:CREB-regulated transcription coactivator 3-like isoform X2 [Hyposmocoma kahamanoa]